MSQAIPCKLYRFTNPDGSTKDWAIGSDNGSLVIFFNKTNARLRMTNVPPNKLPNGVEEELNARTTDQLRQGYQFVNDVLIRDNKVVEINVPEVLQRGALSWEISAVAPNAMLAALTQLGRLFGKKKVAGVRVAMEGEELFCRYHECIWSFGATPRPYGHYNQETGRGGGTVSPELGVVPVLALMGIDQVLKPQVRFCDAKGQEAILRAGADVPWLKPDMFFSQEEIRLLSVRFGLRAPRFSDLTGQEVPAGIGYF